MKKIFTRKQKIIILLLLIGCTPFLIKAALLSSEYGREEQPHLTTQEKFDIVVAGIVSDKRIVQYTVRDYTVNEAGENFFSRRLVKSYKYSSVEEFYAINPHCCIIVDKIFYAEKIFTVPHRLKRSGKLETIIKVSYVAAFDELNNNKPLKDIAYFGLSSAGKLLTIGEVLGLIDPNW